MSAPAGITRVTIRRGNEPKVYVDLATPAVQATSLADLGEAIRKAVEGGAFGPPPAVPAKKPKAEKPTAPPTE